MSISVGLSRLGKRKIAALVALALLPITLPNIADADHSGNAAVQAAQEIQAARDRANAAAQAMSDAETELDRLSVEVSNTEAHLAELETLASQMRSSLKQEALRSFANSGAALPLLIDLDDANDDITANRQAAVARGSAVVELDDFDAVMDEVNETKDDLERHQVSTDRARQNFENLQAAAESEVVQLGIIENERQLDEQVEHELQRQRLERQRQQAAEAAAAAAAAQAAAASSSRSSGSGTSSGSSGSSSSGSSSSGSSSSSSSGSSGSSSPQAPAPAPPPPPSSGSGIACPVAGPRAFSDTWGAPRSGGRSHEGVDMMSPRGTPLVAAESGSAQFKQTNLGGNSVWLTGASGTRYFYAHLSSFAGSSRSVSRGEVIGYVGSTGNTSANHLHFEVRPGGRAVNPYPYVAAAC